MPRELVYYGDLDTLSITDAQYKSNIIYQYPHLDESLPVTELECLIDYLQVPCNVRVAFCQVTKSLPLDIQRLIFELL
jgi:hypothetical protein